jgi:hypothetical protein
MIALPMAAAVALAQQPPQPPTQEPQPPSEPQPLPPDQQAPPGTPSQPAGEPETTATKEISAEVVSADPAAKKINVKVMIKKDASAEPELKEAAIRVDDEAVPALGTVNPGDKVKLLCRMNGNSVIAVKDIKTPAP